MRRPFGQNYAFVVAGAIFLALLAAAGLRAAPGVLILPLEKAFGWAGMSADGLSQIARDMLLLLLGEEKYTASIDTLKGKLSESGPIGQHEQMLFQRAVLTITGRGRKLTDTGIVRAREEAITRS